jgi:RNA recognition motif-containing protein
MKLYVGGLPYSTDEDAIREMFKEYGNVESVQLIVDRYSGGSKGFGFVEMPNNAEADAAIKALNDTRMNGRSIKVNQARAKENRSRDSRQRRY